MTKSLIIAAAEFASYVRTKAFIIGILLAPVLSVAIMVVNRVVEKQVDTTERRFAIVDATGTLGQALERAALEWNATVGGSTPTGPRFVPELMPAGVNMGDTRVRLSERVGREELFAFVEIPAAVLDEAKPAKLRYYSNHPAYSTLPRWIEQTITGQVQAGRLRDAAIDPALVAKLTRPVGIEELGLIERDSGGSLRPAARVDKLRSVGVPLILMILIFMPVMSICPQMAQAVVEEKMSRISEVLLGSVTPFELMLGKLLGAGAVCIVITLTYVGAAAAAAVYWGYADVLEPLLLVEFVVFLALAMLFYGSLYIGIGAASPTMKDSQGLMTPVILLTMLPIFVLGPLMRAPDGMLPIVLSLFPPSTPYLMMFRVAMHPAAPLWQVLLGIVLTAASTVGVVWASGRIFRVGLLAQGKTPSFGELVKWVRA